MANLSELTFKPPQCNKVIRYGSTVLEVLLFVVFHLFGEVVAPNRFVMFSCRSGEKENVFEFGRSGDRCVNPLPIYEEKLPIEDRNFTLDGGTLEGMTCTAIAMDKVFLITSRFSSKA